VQGQAFQVTLQIQSAIEPYTFVVTSANAVSSPSIASAAFNESNGVLTIPTTDVFGTQYSIEMSLTDPANLVFTLTTAAEK
jgi:hypothetical protein